MPFRDLVYPVPERDGLGVHLTLDMAGRRASGRTPNGSTASTTASTPPLRRLLRGDPALLAGSPRRLAQPPYTGVRPKLAPPGEPATDFSIEGPEVHGLAGLVNLFGIESPA